MGSTKGGAAVAGSGSAREKAARPIDPGVDYVTIRAVRLLPRVWCALVGRLKPNGRVLTWAGTKEPDMPEPLTLQAEVPLGGSSRRRLLVFAR